MYRSEFRGGKRPVNISIVHPQFGPQDVPIGKDKGKFLIPTAAEASPSQR